ncbi:stalk domain-containing protein [Paenibacillus sp.]|uniref:stalk domain-containing protein n=1 Tax=Paenibacillus sp. TaxID=58172 RepID=UPI002D49B0B7|nr:stalk domain-containing protein [Paenibacillus sp.]HZG88433.1 stalk domain-containing protein [Paenibacillus sp.]
MKKTLSKFSAAAVLAGALLQAAAPTPGMAKSALYAPIDSMHPDAVLTSQHSGQSLYQASESLTKRWTFSTGDKVLFFGTVGPDGTVYATGQRDMGHPIRVYAISPGGKLLWSYETEGEGIATMELGPDGNLYVNAETVYVLSTKGKLVRKFAAEGWAAAISHDGMVYTYHDDVVAARTKTGEAKWTFESWGLEPWSIVLGKDNTLYAIDQNQGLMAFDAAGGIKWTWMDDAYDYYSGTSLGHDGNIYIYAKKKDTYPREITVLFAIGPDGQKRWELQIADVQAADARGYTIQPFSVGNDGTMYFGASDRLVAITPDGKRKWEAKLFDYGALDGHAGVTSPTIGADGTLYFAADSMTETTIGEKIQWTSNNYLFAYTPDGKKKWSRTNAEHVLFDNRGGRKDWGTGFFPISRPVIAPSGVMYMMGNTLHRSDTKRFEAVMYAFGAPVQQYETAKVSVNGTLQYYDQPAIVSNGAVLVPLKGLFGSLGAQTAWDGAAQAVTATKGSLTIKLTIGSKKAYVGGREVALSVPATVLRGRTYVPLRFVSEALGADVQWDNKLRTAMINGNP